MKIPRMIKLESQSLDNDFITEGRTKESCIYYSAFSLMHNLENSKYKIQV